MPTSRSTTAATAHAPEPHDSVSPEPRSYTRMCTCRSAPATGAPAAMNSTLTPSGNVAGSTRGGRLRSRAFNAATSATAQIRCGLPTDAATPACANPATVAVDSPPTIGTGSPTVRLPEPIWTGTTPARVATSSRVVSAAIRPDDARYRTYARTPLPHISAIVPSAL